LLLGGFGVFLLLLRSFRAYPCTANHQENGAPYQEGPHQSYEVSLANYCAPTFSLTCLLGY